MQLRHEAFAVAIDEGGAFAAQGLGRQRSRVNANIERGGVELHELSIGDTGSRPRRHGDPDAAGIRRVRRNGIKAADASGCQHDRAGWAKLQHLAGLLGANDAHGYDATVLGHEINGADIHCFHTKREEISQWQSLTVSF